MKSEALHYFKMYHVHAERHTGCQLKTLRTDNGGEFTSKAFLAYCDEFGIHRQYTVPYIPEQNPIAERKNRTLVEAARAMLHSACLSIPF